jgi:hypothetical protein
MARFIFSPRGPAPGCSPVDKNAITHKLVTAGWPDTVVGNDPSGFWLRSSHSSARSIEASTRFHSLAGSASASSERTFVTD